MSASSYIIARNLLTHRHHQLTAANSIKHILYFNTVRCSSLYEVSKQPSDITKTAPKFVRSKRSPITLVGPLIAFALGVWQVRRLRWKTNLLKNIEEKQKQEVVPFPDDNLALLGDLEYARVKVTGEFLHDREFYVQPRNRFDEGRKNNTKKRPDVVNLGSAGAHVITPFKLHPSGLVIMVNRGWVPPTKIHPSTRVGGQIEGPVTFNAVVRHTEEQPLFIRKNQPDKDLWFYKDIEQMASKHGTLPVLLDACYESTVQGGPIGGQTRVTHRNDHMMYACIWFSIGTATLLGWFL